jgi:hypothetical protein
MPSTKNFIFEKKRYQEAATEIHRISKELEEAINDGLN